MLQSMGSQRVGHNLATEQQGDRPVTYCLRVEDTLSYNRILKLISIIMKTIYNNF